MSDTDQNEDNLLAPLHEFHQRSQELVKLARAGDWATLEERLAEREKGLPALGDNQFLIAVAKAGQTEQLREGIAAIQALTTNWWHWPSRTKRTSVHNSRKAKGRKRVFRLMRRAKRGGNVKKAQVSTSLPFQFN